VGQWQLKEAEKAGAQLMDNSEVIDVDREKNELIIKDKERIKYEYLIGADGDESVVSKSLGTRSDTLTRGAEIKFDGYEGNALEVFLNYEKLGWGYMWILPYDHGSASLGAGTASKYPSSKRLVENAKEIMLKEKGVDLSKHKPSFRNLKATYGGFRHGNIFLVGDAATFISALWGEGIYPALKSGEIAAKAIINKDYNYKIDVNALYKFHRRGSVFISAINFIPTSFMGKATRVGFKFLPIFLKFDFAKRFIRTFLAKVR
jgi:flavin-dependent dehydrogenase